MEQIRTRTKVFENSFFPYCSKECLKLGQEIQSIDSSKQFKKTILDFIRLKENSIHAINDMSGLKLIARLRVNFIHLNELKFRHNLKSGKPENSKTWNTKFRMPVRGTTI